MTNKTTVAAMDRQCTDNGMTALETSPSADCFTFLQSLLAYINQPVSKLLTQAKISTTNSNPNRMHKQLNVNV
jgi:hypothetical protein